MENILHAGIIDAQAAVLHAVLDHPSLALAGELAMINSSKDQASCKFVCGQTARMMRQNSFTQKLRAQCHCQEVQCPRGDAHLQCSLTGGGGGHANPA